MGFVYFDIFYFYIFLGVLKIWIYYFVNNLVVIFLSIYNVLVLELMWVLIIVVYCVRLCIGFCLWVFVGVFSEMKREGEV